MKLSDIDISKMIPAFMRDDDFNAALAGVLGGGKFDATLTVTDGVAAATVENLDIVSLTVFDLSGNRLTEGTDYTIDYTGDVLTITVLAEGLSEIAVKCNKDSGVIYQAGRIDLAQIWSVIDSLPEDILDELAKELDVNWFLYDADIEKKREIIKRADEIHRHLGTKWAVEEVVKIYFGTGTVIEWWEDGFPFREDELPDRRLPYWFAVQTPQEGMDPELVDHFWEVIEKVKNVRSHIAFVYLNVPIDAKVIARGYVCATRATDAYTCSDTVKCSASLYASGTFDDDECENVFGPDTPTPPGPEPPPLEGTFTVYHLLGWHGGQTVSNRIEGATVTVAVGGETYTGVTDGAGDCVVAIPDVETVDSVTYSKPGGIWIDTVTHPEGLSAQYPEIRCYVDAVSGTVSRKQILKQGATVTLTCSEAGIEAPTRTATTNENGVYVIENVYGCDYDAVAVVEGVTITKTFSAAAPPHRTATLNFSTWG